MVRGNFLIVAHLPHFFLTFLQENIRQLQEMGFDVHCASNIALDRIETEKLVQMGVTAHQINIQRSPYSFQNLNAIRQLAKLMEKLEVRGVHCHTPTGGLVARLAAKKAHIKPVIYTAHGFHFYTGAPLKNWLLYYPVEWLLARYTDVLITINQEDYERAKKFAPNKVYYVPGVGVDVEKFGVIHIDRERKRRELGLHKNDFVLLSVGELIPRKNHVMVLDALALLKGRKEFDNIQYVICGKGRLESELKERSHDLGLDGHVHFLGYRLDISELCVASDLFVFMSLQEGLPVALMEAMASGLPVICSDIRGNVDLVESGKNGLRVDNDTGKVAEAICELYHAPEIRAAYAANARRKICAFSLENIQEQMCDIYTDELQLEPGGVMPRFLNSIATRQRIRMQMGVPLGAILVLSVGEVNKNKNHRVCIEAISHIVNNNVYYLICGKGSLIEYHRKLANRLGVGGRVLFSGYREDVANIYMAADIFVLPSKREGLPMSLMEAMSDGLPCLGSDIRGVRELLKPEFLCLPTESAEFALLLEKLVNDDELQMQMGIANRNKVEAYSKDVVSARMQEIYCSVFKN